MVGSSDFDEFVTLGLKYENLLVHAAVFDGSLSRGEFVLKST